MHELDGVAVLECDRCPELCESRNTIVNGRGPRNARIAFVGAGPGKKEDGRGEPFIGPAGETARQWMISAGIDPKKDVYWLNSTRCIGPPDKDGKERDPTPEEVRNCRDFLMDELEWVNPDLIVPAGGLALENLYNSAKFEGGKSLPITRMRGALLWQDELGKKMVPTLHPASAFHLWSNEKYGIADLTKALRESKQPDVFDAGVGKYTVCLDVESIEHLAELVETEAGVLSLDTETTSLDWQTGKVLCIGVSWQPGTAFVVPVLGLGAEEFWSADDKKHVISALRRIFESDVPKIGQNIKFDDLFLSHDLDIHLRNITFDTMLAYHLFYEEKGHSLETLCNLYTNMGDYGRESAEYKTHMQDCPLDILWKYQGADADCTLRVAIEEDKQFDDAPPERRWVFENITMPLAQAAMHMEENGVLVDMEKADALVETYDALVAADLEKLHAIPEVWEGFNHRSDNQKRKLLFELLGLEPSSIITDKARVASVKIEALEEIGVDKHEVIPILIRLSGLEQIMKTFLKGSKKEMREKSKKGLLNKISLVDTRLHTNYRVDGTETGRFSHSPNIANVVGSGKAKKAAEAAPIREIFIAPEGRVLLSADYSQMELRGLAYIAEDEKLIGVLETPGADVHDFVARQLFDVPDGTPVTKDQRRQAKVFNFGLGYGMTEKTIAKFLGCSEERAAELLDMYFGIVEKLPDYFAKQRRTVRNRHEVFNIFGRRRLFWGVETMRHFGGYRRQMGHVYRESYNFPVQSSASDVHSLATIRLDRDSWLRDNGVMLVASIHDSVMLEVDKDKAEEVARYVQKVMQDTAYEETDRVGRPWIVPVDAEWGPAWEDISHHLTQNEQVHDGAPDACMICEDERKRLAA